MTILSEREHAHYARELIKECGGPEEVGRIADLSGGTLSKYSNVGYDVTMPARVINLLEGHCGKKIYSRALFCSGAEPQPSATIDEVASNLTEAAALLQKVARAVWADKILTPREAEEAGRSLAPIKQYVAELEAILRRADAGVSGLRVAS